MAQPSNKRFLLESDKGTPDGLATLDTNGKMPDAQVPDRLTAPSLSATYVRFEDEAGNPLPSRNVVIKVDSVSGEILDIVSEA